jgi:hypothetical protein
MSNQLPDEHQAALDQAYLALSEYFPHVVLAVQASLADAHDSGPNRFIRWYGDTTTAAGLATVASDTLRRVACGHEPA